MPGSDDITPEFLKKKEQEAAGDSGADPASAAPEESQALTDADTAAGDPSKNEPPTLEDQLGSKFKEALDADREGDEPGFWKGGRKASGSLKGFFGRHKKATMALAAGGGITILGAGAFFGFLNFFKLEHLLNNIDAQTFSRVNATFDRRSDAWVRAYIQMRLLEYNGDVTRNPDGSVDFRSNRVDTDNPLKDFYSTLRSNKFEETVLNKSGIFFNANIAPDGRVRFVEIKVGDTSKLVELNTTDRPITELSDEERSRIFNNIDNTTRQLFEGEGADKKMRKRIKEVVNDNTHWTRVLKRRHIRKDIQNKIGVRDWRFFETTRERVDNRRIEFQRKMWQKLLPESTRSGKFLQCIFGVGACPSNADSNNPANRAAGSFDGSTTDSEDGRVAVDSEGRPIEGEIDGNAGANGNFTDTTQRAAAEVGEGIAENASEKAVRTKIMQQILPKVSVVTGALGAVQTLDMLSRIDWNIVSGGLAALAVLAKGDQAMATYTTYAIARDQTRTGELTSEENALMMETVKGVEKSEAYDHISNKGQGGSPTTSKEEYCAEDYEPEPDEYVWACDKIKVGSAFRAEIFKSLYENSIGRIFSPVMEAYRDLRETPVIGQIIGVVGSIGGAIDTALSAIVSPALDALGVTRGIQYLTAWMTEAAMNFLGGAPILAGAFSPPGLIYTMAVQGGEVTAETFARGSGAAITNPETRLYSDELRIAYLEEERANQSFRERYLDIHNSQSLAARSLFSISTLSFDKLGSFFSGSLKNLGSLFGPKAGAQTAQDNLSGIDTYDFSAFCIEHSPVDTVAWDDNQPAKISVDQMTNADDLLNSAGQPFIDRAEITWTLVKDTDAFWRKVYERVDDQTTDPKTVLQVENCETLNRRMRGSLGYTSGYTDDGGLEDGPSAGQGQGNPGGPINCTGAAGNARIVCAAQQYQGIPYSNDGPPALNGGADAEAWLARNPTPADRERARIDCSGFSNLAMFAAFGYKTTAGCSGNYVVDRNNDGLVDADRNLQRVPLDSLQPGDFLTVSQDCNRPGVPGHIGIFVERLPDGRLRTLESAGGTNVEGQRESGYYVREPGYFIYASRYIGPGSTP